MRPNPHANDDDAPLEDPGRPLPLRLLALVGAFAFLMLGLSTIVLPLLQAPGQRPNPQPAQPGHRDQARHRDPAAIA